MLNVEYTKQIQTLYGGPLLVPQFRSTHLKTEHLTRQAYADSPAGESCKIGSVQGKGNAWSTDD
jgi:hypothetical protein